MGFEWAAVLTGGAVVGTLAVIHAVDRGPKESPEPVAVEVKGAVVPTRPRPSAPAVHVPETIPRHPRSTFAFTAARGDSWFQVRSGSFRGRVLYEGKLMHGDVVRVRSRRLWIRFGAASHLDLTIDGRPVRLPAFGTYDAIATGRRVVADRTIYATAAQSP
jgi:uncharacterized protein DUF4115